MVLRKFFSLHTLRGVRVSRCRRAGRGPRRLGAFQFGMEILRQRAILRGFKKFFHPPASVQEILKVDSKTCGAERLQEAHSRFDQPNSPFAIAVSFMIERHTDLKNSLKEFSDGAGLVSPDFFKRVVTPVVLAGVELVHRPVKLTGGRLGAPPSDFRSGHGFQPFCVRLLVDGKSCSGTAGQK